MTDALDRLVERALGRTGEAAVRPRPRPLYAAPAATGTAEGDLDQPAETRAVDQVRAAGPPPPSTAPAGDPVDEHAPPTRPSRAVRPAEPVQPAQPDPGRERPPPQPRSTAPIEVAASSDRPADESRPRPSQAAHDEPTVQPRPRRDDGESPPREPRRATVAPPPAPEVAPLAATPAVRERDATAVRPTRRVARERAGDDRRRDPSPAEAPPAVEVTIGRIEVRVVPPPAPAPARRADRRPAATSLDDYLRARGAGRP